MAWRKENDLHYLLADHLSSSHAEVDVNQAETGQRRYLPFGSDRGVSGAGDLITDERFTSQRRVDDGSGNLHKKLYHCGARWLLPALGGTQPTDVEMPLLGWPISARQGQAARIEVGFGHRMSTSVVAAMAPIAQANTVTLSPARPLGS